MDTKKYIHRKYPKDGANILNDFDTLEIDMYVKKRNYKIGRLAESIIQVREYPKGTICLHNGLKDYDEDGFWCGTWSRHIIVKCPEGFTQSGYHSFTLTNPKIINCK